MSEPLSNDQLDCDDGCSDEFPHKHKWEIEPHPYNCDFDVYVTDDDSEALLALQKVCEDAWYDCEPGQEKIIKVRHNEMKS